MLRQLGFASREHVVWQELQSYFRRAGAVSGVPLGFAMATPVAAPVTPMFYPNYGPGYGLTAGLGQPVQPGMGRP